MNKPQSREGKKQHSGWLPEKISDELQHIKTNDKISIQHQIEIGAWLILSKYSKLPPQKLEEFKEQLNIKDTNT